MRLLIIGGYGTFGGRLARLLADEPRVETVIAGRSLSKAEAFCAALPPGAPRRATVFDRDGDLTAQMTALAPDLVVDASGPWQAYGERPYRVAEACVALGVDYLDLADGSEFVAGVGALDEMARAAGVAVLSGVSTCPVLTFAAARRLSRGLDVLSSITGGIAPSPHAGLGLNVIRAVTAYAGKLVTLWDGGGPASGWGLMDTRRVTIAVPGRLPLDSRLFSLVDTPDLKLAPRTWPELRSVWMGAGPVPEILHRLLNLAGWLPRLGLVRSLTPLSPLFHAVMRRLCWGAHRGGMFVRVTGEVGGRPSELQWNLIAEGDDGPFIPSMAAEALVRRRLAGVRPDPGARPCIAELELEDFEPLFARRAIFTGVHSDEGAGDRPLYRRALGPVWDSLPSIMRRMHSPGERLVVEGRAQVERSRNPLAWLIGAIVGFPNGGDDVPVSVEFTVKDGVETWRRRFDGKPFVSTQEIGRGRFDRLIVERFGPLAFGLAALFDNGRLSLVVKRWTAFGIPMPPGLAPVGDAFEEVREGRFHFDVEIVLPLAGRIGRYSGWLERREVAQDREPGQALAS